METAAAINAPQIETTLNLRLPRGLNFFTQDHAEIGRIRDHFAPIIEDVRGRCAHAGLLVTDAARYTGEIRIRGDADVIGALQDELAREGLIFRAS